MGLSRDSMMHNHWLAKHPYLQEMADLHSHVDTVLEDIRTELPGQPDWDHYITDFNHGIPLLHSAVCAIDLNPPATTLVRLVARLTNLSSVKLKDIAALHSELTTDLFAPGRALGHLLARETFLSASPGLLQYLGWTVLTSYLKPLANEFEQRREPDQWLLPYCPMCGSPPNMGQLKGIDPGRQRYLACGRCGSHWSYRRTGCPFCEKEDDHRLAVLTIDEEAPLRIDYCESCKGYLKTYDGAGNESLFLADWTSIHLDIVARDRGLKQRAASLYQV
jgi:FdhE protein